MGSQQQDFAIVKINTSWSKTMTVSTMILADLRAVNQDMPYSKLVSSLQNLCNKWDPRDIMPPYIEFVAGLFPANIMKKPTIVPSNFNKKTGPGTNGLHNTNQTMKSKR